MAGGAGVCAGRDGPGAVWLKAGQHMEAATMMIAEVRLIMMCVPHFTGPDWRHGESWHQRILINYCDHCFLGEAFFGAGLVGAARVAGIGEPGEAQ